MGVSIHPHASFDPALDVCNGNFCTLWSSLGIDTGEDGCLVGEIHPIALLRRLDAIEPAWCERAEQNPAVNFRIMALSREQAERYWVALRGVCRVAIERGVMVEWA